VIHAPTANELGVSADRLALFPSEAMLAVERELAGALEGVPNRGLLELLMGVSAHAVQDLAPLGGANSVTFADGREVVLQAAERRALMMRMKQRGLARGVGDVLAGVAERLPFGRMKRFKAP
jgi:hypothetical protein